MEIAVAFFRLAGGLSLFLYGLNVMSDALQRAAGKRMQSALNFMSANRFAGVLSGLAVTAIVQSSSAVTVIVVTFVGAGLLTLTQAIGVIMGANIGTTLTAWIVAALGFKVEISAFALPAIAIGFILRSIRWNKRSISLVGLGNTFMGLGLLFLGLDFLTGAIAPVKPENIAHIVSFFDKGVIAIILSVVVGAILTAIINSSSAMTAIIITLAHEGLITFDIACAMVLGANIGTTINAALAAIGAGRAALRAALVHILFNTIGAVLCVIFFRPVTLLVDAIVPGTPNGELITIHVAAFHTAFNIMATLAFLPFVNQYAKLITWLVKEKEEIRPRKFKLDIPLGIHTPELYIVRAEKEIRDLASLVFSMYQRLRVGLEDMRTDTVQSLTDELWKDEEYADEVREELTKFLMTISHSGGLNKKSEHNVTLLIRIIADLEDMTDDCYSIGMLLLRNARKERVFKDEEMSALQPYMGLIENFLSFVREHLGGKLSAGESVHARKIENEIDESRNKLRRLAQHGIEQGKDIKVELTYIDLVRRLERLGDFCNGITSALAEMA